MGAVATEDLRERIARAKRAHSLLAAVLAEGIGLRPSGRGRWQGCCPFHDDRNPSLTLYEDEGRFRCFGGACGARGDILDWYRLRRGLDLRATLDLLDTSPPPAAPPSVLAARAHPGTAAGRDAAPRWEVLGYEEQAVMNRAGDWYRRCLRATPAALAYLERRGIPPAVIASQRLGYSDGAGLHDALGDDRLREVARDLGLLALAPPYREYGAAGGASFPRGAWRETLAGRLVIPELRGGQPIWFAGRLLDETPDTGLPARGWSRPKYRNLRGARPVLGYERVAGRREVFLVEGPFDYLTAVAWGLPACCTCGTNFRLDQLGFLASADRIFGIFDGDAAGRAGIRRFGPVLGDALRPLALPEGLDLNALALLPGGRARFEALLAEGRRGNFLRPPGDVCPVPA